MGLRLANSFPGSDVFICSPWVEGISQVDNRPLINMYIDKNGWLKSMDCHCSRASEIELHHFYVKVLLNRGIEQNKNCTVLKLKVVRTMYVILKEFLNR